MIYTLLVLFQLKHFIADYPLQTPYMLGKFKSGYDWVLPLSTHCLVHAVFTFLISIYFTWDLYHSLIYSALDFFIHFLIDRIKASPNLLGRYKPLTAETYPSSTQLQRKHNSYFWYSLGLDQGVHHLTHYVIIYLIMR